MSRRSKSQIGLKPSTSYSDFKCDVIDPQAQYQMLDMLLTNNAQGITQQFMSVDDSVGEDTPYTDNKNSSRYHQNPEDIFKQVLQQSVQKHQEIFEKEQRSLSRERSKRVSPTINRKKQQIFQNLLKFSNNSSQKKEQQQRPSHSSSFTNLSQYKKNKSLVQNKSTLINLKNRNSYDLRSNIPQNQSSPLVTTIVSQPAFVNTNKPLQQQQLLPQTPFPLCETHHEAQTLFDPHLKRLYCARSLTNLLQHQHTLPQGLVMADEYCYRQLKEWKGVYRRGKGLAEGILEGIGGNGYIQQSIVDQILKEKLITKDGANRFQSQHGIIEQWMEILGLDLNAVIRMARNNQAVLISKMQFLLDQYQKDLKVIEYLIKNTDMLHSKNLIRILFKQIQRQSSKIDQGSQPKQEKAQIQPSSYNEQMKIEELIKSIHEKKSSLEDSPDLQSLASTFRINNSSRPTIPPPAQGEQVLTRMNNFFKTFKQSNSILNNAYKIKVEFAQRQAKEDQAKTDSMTKELQRIAKDKEELHLMSSLCLQEASTYELQEHNLDAYDMLAQVQEFQTQLQKLDKEKHSIMDELKQRYFRNKSNNNSHSRSPSKNTQQLQSPLKTSAQIGEGWNYGAKTGGRNQTNSNSRNRDSGCKTSRSSVQHNQSQQAKQQQQEYSNGMKNSNIMMMMKSSYKK